MIEKIKEERRRRERERIGDRPIIEIPKPPPEKDPQKKEEPEQGS
jgi:hypothetical protein